MVRARLAGGVTALLLACVQPAATAAPGSAPGTAPGSVDTWTITGCDIRLANTFVAAHKHVAAHWHTDGTATCTGTQVDAEVRIDLMRNGVSLPDSFARGSCSLTSLKPCAVVDVAHDTTYRKPRANWRPRLVLFIRGPLSVVTDLLSDYCVVDVPSFETICTFVGRTTRQ